MRAFSSSTVSVDFLVYKRTRAMDSFLRPMAWKYFSLPLPLATSATSTGAISTKISSSLTTGFGLATALCFTAAFFPEFGQFPCPDATVVSGIVIVGLGSEFGTGKSDLIGILYRDINLGQNL